MIVPALANAKHTVGLVLAATGAVCVLLGLGCFAAGVMAINNGKGDQIAGMFGCSAVAFAVSLFLVWRGVVMRKRAIAAGSTMHLDPNNPIRTTRSGTAKPSFLEKPKEDEWER
jgi:hypothetical protein